jgi:uncharacterized protein YqeY
MASLAERLEEDMKTAMRAGDKLTLGVVRRARSAIKNAEIANKGPIDDAAAEKVLRTLVKQHKESIEGFRAGGRPERIADEEAEMAVLENYLPQQLGADAIEPVVRELAEELGASSPKDMGTLMKAVMAKLGGAADGSVVSGVVKQVIAERAG